MKALKFILYGFLGFLVVAFTCSSVSAADLTGNVIVSNLKPVVLVNFKIQ